MGQAARLTRDGVEDGARDGDDLDSVIAEAMAAFKQRQKSDGHWLFELEPDVTISSEYIFLQHFLGTIDEGVETKIANFIRSIQGENGGWGLFHGAEPNISATVKAYYALKLAGDAPEAAHMRRAREVILSLGGLAQCNVFTRTALALFEQVPWRAVPVMPVEIMLLPKWFLFHLSKVSYWSRTVIVPLLILMTLKPKAKNPKGIGVRELFLGNPEAAVYPLNPTGTPLGAAFKALDAVLRRIEPLFPKAMRGKSIRRATEFVIERLNGDEGLGGIFPAMANCVMAFEALGYARDEPDFVVARRSIDRLLITRGSDKIYCQPCLSPVWDTCLGMHALLEAGEDPNGETMKAAGNWLLEHEITELQGDWSHRRPNLAPGGWAFQYWNNHYPDVDDTAVIGMALQRMAQPQYEATIKRTTDWIIGMQSKNGGWGAFDPENTHYLLNYIPFADHGALLDPPTADVTARCLSMLTQFGYRRDHPAVRKAHDYLKRDQEPDGSWFGRWGANYIYGTWSVLSALNAVGEDLQSPFVRKAVDYLLSSQRQDGGWGEDLATYWKERRGEAKASTPSQTAWALLGLMAAGEVENEAVARGIAYLVNAERDGARWQENYWTGVGFPRVFFLKYHGYAAYFPLWALARYRNLIAGNDRRVRYGM